MDDLTHLFPAALQYAAAFACGYILGSIPFGLIITQFAGTQDIRSIGSGNIGATNVLRTGRKSLAALTLLCDALKGTAAVIIVNRLGGHELVLIAAIGAFLGHLFPAWLKFKGGKGVATYIGLLIAIGWSSALAFCAIWIAVAAITRYSSLSALIASAATPFILWFTGYLPEAQLFAFLTLLLWIKHRDNLMRLLSGNEGKIGGSHNARA